MDLAEKRIALGVTGGIAAYKSAELVRLFVKQGASVRVAMTRAATHFVTPTTFQALSGKRVFTDLWDNNTDNGLAHINFSREADALVIAPASANFIAKTANGIADDLLSALTLARDCPLLLVPAMNGQMWKNPATQRNIATLRADGVTILGPANGEQACGEIGEGRMIEPEEIFEDIVAFFQPKHLAGKKALITAGPTFETIDPVRGITNLSSGKMGFAIARAARESGAEVTLISGPVNQPTPRGVSRIDVTTALEMRSAVLQQVSSQDIFIAVAAVADYRPKIATAHKVKKDASAAPTIDLIQNPDILSDVVALPDPPFCVGFAAESQNLTEYAEKKRRAKKIPLIVGNLIQDGFGGDENTLILFDEHGQTPLGPEPKIQLARKIMERIATLLKGKNHATH